MLISLNWINEFVDIHDLDPHALAERITMASAEVEHVTVFGQEIEGIVVGRVVEWRKHPDSKKLSLPKVDIGGEIVESVCGAPNCREGLLTVFCKAGGRIRGVGTVQARKVGGYPSNGVCCSPAECGLGDTHEQIVELPETFRPGDDIKTLAGIDDVVLEIDNKSLTHRPDLWGHYGFAREIAALVGRPLKPLPHLSPDTLKGRSTRRVPVTVEDADGCPRYSCLRFDNLRPLPSPLWMQVRLYHCGLRAISLAVDLTNYLLLELGQPMHAFDAEKIQSIRVASLREPIRFTTLDGIERTVPPNTVLICDGEQPIALAGIMGGLNSEVSENTTSVVLESANFNPYRIRRASIEIGHRTDSSLRFEKSLDPAMTVQAIGRFALLLREIDPGVTIGSELEDVDFTQKAPVELCVTAREIDRAVGEHVPAERVVDILRRLSFDVQQDGDVFRVVVPTFRATKDVTIAADVVEEVARVYGYDRVPATAPRVRLERYRFNYQRQLERRAKRTLAQRFGLLEAHTYPWVYDPWLKRLGEREPGDTLAGQPVMRLSNAPAPETARLRPSLVPNLLALIERNQQWADRLGFFEIGSVFVACEDGCAETTALGIVLADRLAREGHDGMFFQLKGLIEWLFRVLRNTTPTFLPFNNDTLPSPWVHPCKGCWITLADTSLGHFGSIQPEHLPEFARGTRLALCEINFGALAAIPEQRVTAAPIPRFPLVDLDFSFLVDETVRFADVERTIARLNHPLFRSSRLVDVYSGETLPPGKKSFAVRVIIGADDRTLKSKEIDEFNARMIACLEAAGYVVRTG